VVNEPNTPAVLTGQFMLVEGRLKKKGLTAPIGVILSATLSADPDQLSRSGGQLVRLRPPDWQSGDNTWIAVAGDSRIIAEMAQKLKARLPRNKPVKMWVKDQGGQVRLAKIDVKPSSSGEPASRSVAGPLMPR
jgi:hypothetical protein